MRGWAPAGLGPAEGVVENADERKVPVALVVVEPVAHDEDVRDDKADVVHR
jgi:hypothetical protein